MIGQIIDQYLMMDNLQYSAVVHTSVAVDNVIQIDITAVEVPGKTK